MQNLATKLFKIVLGFLIVFCFQFSIFFIVSSLPSKTSFEYKPDLPPMFKKLAEYKSYSSSFLAVDDNLCRIDVLFKNQALESKEKLKVQIFDYKQNIIFEQDYDSGNFGDTNRVRMDFDLISDSKNKRYEVLITPLQIVDWKLFFGVKGDDIDLIQYYEKSFNLKDGLYHTVKLYNNFVLLVPYIFFGIFLW